MTSATVEATADLPANTRALVLDLVEWLSLRPREYHEVMAAWRTSCPRLTVWEDAMEAGVVEQQHLPDGATVVRPTRRGRALLREAGRG